MSGGDGGFAGRLRERVTIERRTAARDALAGADGAWNMLATRWAAVAADGTGEAVAGETADAAPRFSVTLRRGAALSLGDRIIWAGRRLRVRAVIDDPARADRIVVQTEEMR